jgi:hypothetical protein
MFANQGQKEGQRRVARWLPSHAERTRGAEEGHKGGGICWNIFGTRLGGPSRLFVLAEALAVHVEGAKTA